MDDEIAPSSRVSGILREAPTQPSPRRVHSTPNDSDDFCCRVWA